MKEIEQWLAARQRAVEAVNRERELREQLATLVFPTPVIGTNNDEATGLKLIEGESWSVDQKKVGHVVQQLMDGGCNINPFVWKAEISRKNYDLLDKKWKDIVDTVLTIKRSMPQLKLKMEK
jgi:plasmid stabilization system protein ParE